jgi:hypothetical protein
MLDHQSQALLASCQFCRLIKLPIHWDKQTKKLIAIPPSSKHLLLWYWCLFGVSFGTLTSVFLSVRQLLMSRDNVRVSPIAVISSVLVVVLGSYVVYMGRVFLVYATHTVFFWTNLQSFKFAKKSTAAGTIYNG